MLEPKVTLLDSYQHPIKTMHAMAWNMRGKMLHDLSGVTMEEAIKTLNDFDPAKTRLIGVLEFAKFVFQVEGVPRAFTHQLVRHRTSSFSQESLRFTVKEGGDFSYDIGPSVENAQDPDVKILYCEAMESISEYYTRMLKAGVATQDARGLLPINILTKIGFQIDFRALIGIAEVRECFQSQDHWKPIMRQIKKELREKVEGGDILASWLIAACERTGRCEFKSVWDRECPKEAVLRDNVCRNCFGAGAKEGVMERYCRSWKENGPCGAMTRFMGMPGVRK